MPADAIAAGTDAQRCVAAALPRRVGERSLAAKYRAPLSNVFAFARVAD